MTYNPDNGGGSTPGSDPFTPYVSGRGSTYPTYADVSPRVLDLAVSSFRPPAHAFDTTPSIPVDGPIISGAAPGSTVSGATNQGTAGTTATGNFGAVLDLFRNMFSSGSPTAALSQQTGTPVLVQNGTSPMNGKVILIIAVVLGAAWFAHKRGMI